MELNMAGNGEPRTVFEPGCESEQIPGIIPPLPRLVSADWALDIGDAEREKGLRRAREEAGSEENVGKRLSQSASARVGGRAWSQKGTGERVC